LPTNILQYNTKWIAFSENQLDKLSKFDPFLHYEKDNNTDPRLLTKVVYLTIITADIWLIPTDFSSIYPNLKRLKI